MVVLFTLQRCTSLLLHLCRLKNNQVDYFMEGCPCKLNDSFVSVPFFSLLCVCVCVFQDGRAPSGVLVCAMFCFCHLFANPVPAMQLLSAKRPGSGLWPSHRR